MNERIAHTKPLMIQLNNIEKSCKNLAESIFALWLITLDIVEGNSVTVTGLSCADKSTPLTILGMYEHDNARRALGPLAAGLDTSPGNFFHVTLSRFLVYRNPN